MTLRSATLRESLWLGACYSLLAWTVYGIAEFAFSSLLPAVLQQSSIYTPLQYETTALLFGIYEIAGIGLGLCIGALLWTLGKRSELLGGADVSCAFPAAAQIGVLAISAINLARIRPFIALALPLALTVALAGLSLWCIPSPSRFRRFRLIGNPWTASILILGVPWLTKELLWDRPLSTRLVAAGLAIAAIASTSILVFRFLQSARVGPALSSVLFAAALLALVSIGFSYAFDGHPKAPPQPVPAAAVATARPSVILITLDAVRADHLSVYGYARETTPQLRKFAADATVFTRAVSSSDTTLPSHASMFTGLYPSWHGAHVDSTHPLGSPLARQHRTLAQILSESGYLTIGVTANRASLQPASGLNRGFQYYNVQAPFFPRAPEFYLRSAARWAIEPALERRFGQTYRRAEEVNDTTLSILEQSSRKTVPFFLFVNYMDAHWPYDPPEPFDTLFPGKSGGMTNAQYEAMSMAVMKRERGIAEAERQHLLSQYDGGIAYIDAQLGVLFDRLKQLRLYDNSLIIVTSDHGEPFGERNIVGNPGSVYQDQVHVPLLIKYPQDTTHSTVDTPAGAVDLLPTILEVAGEKAPAAVQGRSLLHPKAMNDGTVLTESFPGTPFAGWSPRFRHIGRALYSGSLKLIDSAGGERELYDLSKDPNEQRNLLAADPSMGEPLSSALDALLNTAPGHHGLQD